MICASWLRHRLPLFSHRCFYCDERVIVACSSSVVSYYHMLIAVSLQRRPYRRHEEVSGNAAQSTAKDYLCQIHIMATYIVTHVHVHVLTDCMQKAANGLSWGTYARENSRTFSNTQQSLSRKRDGTVNQGGQKLTYCQRFLRSNCDLFREQLEVPKCRHTKIEAYSNTSVLYNQGIHIY